MRPHNFSGYQRQDVEQHLQTLKYLSQPEYMDTLLVNFDFPSVLETFSKFLQEISRCLGLFALHNYLHKVVTPGIPEFPNWKELTRFWVDVCVDKLKKYVATFMQRKTSLHKIIWKS